VQVPHGAYNLVWAGMIVHLSCKTSGGGASVRIFAVAGTAARTSRHGQVALSLHYICSLKPHLIKTNFKQDYLCYAAVKDADEGEVGLGPAPLDTVTVQV
jgi:hypothetical protein